MKGKIMQTKKNGAANRSLLGYGKIKAAEDGSLYIEGFANKNVVDRGNEIITTDAWDLDNYKKNPVILYNHGMDPQLGGTPIGVATEVKPTKDGLYIKARLSKVDDPMLKRIRGLVEERVLRAFSVGFNPTDTDTDKDTGARRITKAELFEVSIVGVPMNQDSLFELSSKMIQSKSLYAIKKDVLKRKGAWVAGAVHNRIYELQKNDRMDREAALEKIASMADVELDALMDILAGNVTPVPEAVLVAFSEVLGMELQQLQELDKGDAELDDDAEPLAEEESDDEDEVDEESDDGNTAAADDEDDDKQADQGVDTEKEPEGAEDHNQEDTNRDERDSDDDQTEKPAGDKGKKDAFQDCVSAKIPKLIAEGRDQDEAVAIAISMCKEKSAQFRNVKPTKANYVEFFRVADECAKKKTKPAKTKQADQSDAPDKVEETTTPIAAKDDGMDDDGNPMLAAQKQTNILLGQLIAEIQIMSKKLDGLTKPVEEKPTDETPAGETDAAKTDAGKEDDEEKPSAEDEAKFADPVTRKIPISTKEEVETALKGVLATKSPQLKVFKRIVEKSLELGVELDALDGSDLCRLLPDELKDKVRESIENAEVKMLDSYRKRLENVKERLSRLEA